VVDLANLSGSGDASAYGARSFWFQATVI